MIPFISLRGNKKDNGIMWDSKFYICEKSIRLILCEELFQGLGNLQIRVFKCFPQRNQKKTKRSVDNLI